MKKVLAIDFGTKRIGLAISRGTLADPLRIIANDDRTVEALREIIKEEHVDLLLIGISEREMAVKTREFADMLREALQLPIEFADETLSSKVVHQQLAMGPMKLSRRREPIDHFAAAQVLQEWLDGAEL